MVPKFCAIVVLVLFALANQARAQEECVAEGVVNMTLSNRHFLTWEVDPDDKCIATQFLVYIFRRDHPVEYSFETTQPEVDVSFLPVCEEWTFVVVPVAGHTRGQEHRLFGAVPLPWNADLSIGYIEVNHNSVTNENHLTWALTDTQYGDCSLRYRVTIEEDENPDIYDIYTNEKSINLHFLSPCTNYQIGIRAINVAHPTIEGSLRSRYYDVPGEVQAPPRLESLELRDTSFNITWELERTLMNRCPVSEFYVYGGTFFNRSVLYYDTPERRFIDLEVDSLRPNSMYYIRASVQNSAGWSDAAVVAIQTLENPPAEGEVVDVNSMWRYLTED